jgi:hypothetical protein
MSCFRLPPALRWASGMDSRSLHRFSRESGIQVLVVGAGEFDQQVPGTGCDSRIARSVYVLEHQCECRVRNQFERRQPVIAGVAQAREQFQCSGWRGYRHPGCRGGARPRKQFQAGRGDHAERALAADQQLREVVASVVLRKRCELRDHAAVSQHGFQPVREIARHAIAQHCGAAGIGGEIATDLAAAFRAETQREHAIRLQRSFLHGSQRAAGLCNQREVSGIDTADAVHPAHHQHHAARIHGRGSPHVACVATLRHDWNAQRIAQGEHGGDLRRIRRQRHRSC